MTTNPTRTYQLFVAPTEYVVETQDDPEHEARIEDDADGNDPCITIMVQRGPDGALGGGYTRLLQEGPIEILSPEGVRYTQLEELEVIPQDFSVGDVVYMNWFYKEWSPGQRSARPTGEAPIWDLEAGTIRVRSIAGWDREVGNIGWHEPQPIAGTREYLVTLPEGFKVSSLGGSFTYKSKSTTVTVLEVIN